MKPCHVELQGPLLSTEVPFVRLNLENWMLADHKAQTKDSYKLVDRLNLVPRGGHISMNIESERGKQKFSKNSQCTSDPISVKRKLLRIFFLLKTFNRNLIEYSTSPGTFHEGK